MSVQEVIYLANELIEKLNYLRLEELTKEIKNISELSHLFDTDPDVEYICRKNSKCKNFSHLQKCIIQTSKFNFLEEYIDLYLTKHPESINYQNEKGWTALMITSRNFNFLSTEKTVEILLKHKADVNLQDKCGCTALIRAASTTKKYSTEKIIKLLLEHNANINIQDTEGWTALIYASSLSGKCSTENTVKLLLDHNADVNLKTNRGLKALDLSVLNFKYSTRETIKMLLKKTNGFIINEQIMRLNNIPNELINLIMEKQDSVPKFINTSKNNLFVTSPEGEMCGLSKSSFTFEIGKIPIVDKSRVDPNDLGGYYIIKGKEKIINFE